MGLRGTSAAPVSAAIPSSVLRRTQWSFFALCGYLLSQVFTIPILAIGPSWAVWPTLSDFAVGWLFLTFAFTPQSLGVISRAGKTVSRGLMFIFGASILSYCFVFILFSGLIAQPLRSSLGVSFGAFSLYRLAQFFLVFWATARIPLTPERITTLRYIVSLVFVVLCVGIGLTYFSIVPPSVLCRHLPWDSPASGPWRGYALSTEGLGAVGYNHGYVALQVVMFLSLAIHLNLGRKSVLDYIFLLACILACFLSGSRAGLATSLVFAVALFAKNPMGVVLFAITVSGAALTVPADWFSTLEATTERQLTLAQANEPENLSGRTYLWRFRLAFLNEDPIRWIIGSGFGSTMESGEYAHMLYLTLVVENGLIGLGVFLFLTYRVLWYLRRHESGVQPILWVTIAFLFSSITQENFYPIASFGHFLGLYLCALAIALRSKSYIRARGQFRTASFRWQGVGTGIRPKVLTDPL